MHIDFFIDVCIDLQMHMGRFIVAAICVRRSEGVPERRIFSLGALPGWVVRDSAFLVVVVVE